MFDTLKGMDAFKDSREIFRQLADVDGNAGVRTLIETHDAWVHNTAVLTQIDAVVRMQVARSPRPESIEDRIARQRQALSALVMKLPRKNRTAG
jgi:hypothetical protein